MLHRCNVSLFVFFVANMLNDYINHSDAPCLPQVEIMNESPFKQIKPDSNTTL